MVRKVICLLMAVAMALATASWAQAEYVDAVLASNPILYYRMQELNPVDDAAAVNSAATGTDFNGVYSFTTAGSITDTTGVEGYLSPAKRFTPGDGRVAVPSGFGGSALSAFTFEFFFRANAQTYGPDGIKAIFASDSWGDGRVHFNLFESNVQMALFDNKDVGAWPTFNLEAVAPADVWRHLAFTYEATGSNYTVAMYVDGAPSGSVTVTESGTAGSVNFFDIDASVASWENTRFLNADISQFAVYDYALTPAQVATHFSAVPEPSGVTLVALGAASSMWFLRRRFKR